ncbi:hypothetical protein [Zunongwangia pacifica]|uniref:Uncharacterized protein n=1 Tax=Zunongwangia pacifica TaxID=2911062 RepID=A0A9X2CNY7_9FLAO|nr:hypothetical protein [Zunongwangia pacifica]MCL6217458.1 hypothetical protein [Zunongwangia pacifica]
MKQFWLKYSSLFLLVLLPAGPILWSAHIILNEHANSFEVHELSFQKIASPHVCAHFLLGESRGILPKISYKQEPALIVVIKDAFSEKRISHKTFYQLRFYVRGPPLFGFA